MALIKHAQTRTLASDAIVLDLGDLRREAERMRERAERDAARIIADARAERERIIGGAREEGFESGRAAGYDEGHAEGRLAGLAEAKAEAQTRLDSLANALAEVLDRIDGEHEATSQQARRDVLELAISMGERIARRAVELDPDAAVRQVEAALAIVLRATDLTVRVHTSDLATVEEALPALARRLEQSGRVRVEPDDSLTRGSAIVRTEKGEVDATIEGQIERLIESIRPIATGAGQEPAP